MEEYWPLYQFGCSSVMDWTEVVKHYSTTTEWEWPTTGFSWFATPSNWNGRIDHHYILINERVADCRVEQTVPLVLTDDDLTGEWDSTVYFQKDSECIILML